MYVVKEMFYTLQGEGANAGRPAVFVRFAGCNLWSGRGADRLAALCRICDTDFTGGDKVSAADLGHAASDLWPGGARINEGLVNGLRPLAVLTGGEPMLQVDDAVVASLHSNNFEVAIETNGTMRVPRSVDWVTVSPKPGTDVVQRSGNELKFVFPQDGVDPASFLGWAFDHFYVQPCDGPLREHNTESALRYCLQNPRWKLSLQTHKILNIR